MHSAAPPLPPGIRASGQMPQPVVNLKADVTEEIDLEDAEILDVVQEKPARIRKAIVPIMMRRPSEQQPKISESVIK